MGDTPLSRFADVVLDAALSHRSIIARKRDALVDAINNRYFRAMKFKAPFCLANSVTRSDVISFGDEHLLDIIKANDTSQFITAITNFYRSIKGQQCFRHIASCLEKTDEHFKNLTSEYTAHYQYWESLSRPPMNDIQVMPGCDVSKDDVLRIALRIFGLRSVFAALYDCVLADVKCYWDMYAAYARFLELKPEGSVERLVQIKEVFNDPSMKDARLRINTMQRAAVAETKSTGEVILQKQKRVTFAKSLCDIRVIEKPSPVLSSRLVDILNGTARNTRATKSYLANRQ